MMPIKGMLPEEIVLPKKTLSASSGIYFSSVALSMWDNIHGPKILQVWNGPEVKSPPGGIDKLVKDSSNGKQSRSTDVLEDTLTASSSVLSDSVLLSIANYTLNDEAGRAEHIRGIESKFYSLSKFNLVAFASIFTIEISKGKTEVFSFLLVLPLSETSEFLARYALCEHTVQKLLQDCFLTPLNEIHRLFPRRQIKAKVDEVLKGFDRPLLRFTQTMLCVKQYALPDKIMLVDTHLGKDSCRPDVKHFLAPAITSHIQTSGYTIVLGSDKAAVDKMILTLGVFLSVKERKMSRLVCDRDQKDGWGTYEPHLFLQGYVVSRDSVLPFTKNEIYLNKLPPTIIYLDEREVFVVEPRINLFIWRKEENRDTSEKKQAKGDCPLTFKDCKELDMKEMMSPLVQDFLNNLWLLNTVGGQRESFIGQFLRLIKLKALALAKYLDTDSKPVSHLDMAVEVFTLRPANPAAVEKNKITSAAVQQDLAIECIGDLYTILSFTEKIRPRTYIDVLGDPQLDNLAVIEEFASL